jgi:hypothetical protein
VVEKEHSRMTFETAKKAIDFLIDQSRDQKDLSILFFGGEPLLEAPLIKDIVRYSREKGSAGFRPWLQKSPNHQARKHKHCHAAGTNLCFQFRVLPRFVQSFTLS